MATNFSDNVLSRDKYYVGFLQNMSTIGSFSKYKRSQTTLYTHGLYRLAEDGSATSVRHSRPVETRFIEANTLFSYSDPLYCICMRNLQ